VPDNRTLPFKEQAYKQFKEAMVSLENGEYQEPLEYAERKEIKVLLSWGGPSDGFTIYFDTEGKPVEGFYFFASWFEYEEFKLSQKQLELVLMLYFP
jgi:hypothetical protein